MIFEIKKQLNSNLLMEEFEQTYLLIIETSKSFKENLIENPEAINLQNLLCPICFEIYFNPVSENKNNHTFCSNCIQKHFKYIGKFCPLCKTELNEEENEELKDNNEAKLEAEANKTFLIPAEEKIKLENPEINLIKIKCAMWEKGCKFKTEYNHKNYFNHLLNCEFYQATARKLLNEIVDLMIKIINLEINSHLKSTHESIHSDYCRDWNWLYEESRDWKWWWWASNPWWTSSCEPCNVLWHKYELLLDFKIEDMRKELIKVVKKDC